jgi:hypothetical protein
MTPLVWANFPLALLFLLAWAGHPLRMTLRHPGTVPDRAAAHAYRPPRWHSPPAASRKPTAAAALSSTERTGEEPRADPAGDKTIRASQPAGKTIAINADGAP